LRHLVTLTLAAALGLTGCKGCSKESAPPVAAPSPAARTEATNAAARGVDTAGQAPNDHQEEWGTGLQMVLDGEGHPLLAYFEHDPQGSQEADAHQVTFIGWDAEKKAFRAPLRVAAVHVAMDDHPLAMARDATTGALALVFVNEHPQQKDQQQVTLATSRDAGLTWKVAPLHVDPEAQSPRSAAVVLGGGQVFVAWVGSAVMFAHGALDADPSTWGAPRAMPVPEGHEFHRNAAPSIALDAAGKPAVAVGVSKGVTLAFAYGRFDGTAPVIALDTAQQNDSFDQVLLFQGSNPRILLASELEGREQGEAWFLRSDDGGKSFGKPVLVPNDGGRRMGGPLGLAAAPSGQLAATLHFTGGTREGVLCASPLLARSKDGTAFTTCSPPGAMAVDDEANVVHYNAAVAFAGERAVVAFLEEGFEKPRLLKVWRER
jgi:hypothetical protein